MGYESLSLFSRVERYSKNVFPYTFFFFFSLLLILLRVFSAIANNKAHCCRLAATSDH